MSERTGFVGLGNMGRAMAESLLKAGYGLRVYNRDSRKAQSLVAQGAQQVMRPGEAVEPEGIVICYRVLQKDRDVGLERTCTTG